MVYPGEVEPDSLQRAHPLPLGDAHDFLGIQKDLHNAIRELSSMLDLRKHAVDEYTSKNLAGDQELALSLLPQFARRTIRVEHIIVGGPGTGGATTQEAGGTQFTTPSSSTTLAGITVPPLIVGVPYLVQWTVDLDGTPGAGDVNNFRLKGAGIGNIVSENDGAVGHYSQVPETFTPTATTELQVANQAAGTSGAVYSATLTATPLPVTFQLQLGDRILPNLSLPSDGVFEMSPKSMILYPRDIRQVTFNAVGQYFFEILGYADVPSIR